MSWLESGPADARTPLALSRVSLVWSLLSASAIDITRFGNSLCRRLRNTALGGRGVHGLERVAARNASEPCFRAARRTRAEVAGPDGCVWANDRGKRSAGGCVSL
jgi:hypothetical protein